ncbi:MAG TPA: hypothetical protein VNP92_16365, partial [Actinophytocola sp.]|nr:hypothetical protein [Actinophytocola sp.]
MLDAQPVQRPAALRELLPDSPSPSRMETVFSISAGSGPSAAQFDQHGQRAGDGRPITAAASQAQAAFRR